MFGVIGKHSKTSSGEEGGVYGREESRALFYSAPLIDKMHAVASAYIICGLNFSFAHQLLTATSSFDVWMNSRSCRLADYETLGPEARLVSVDEVLAVCLPLLDE